MMDLTMQAIVMGRSLRSSYNLKTRQPLKKLFLVDRNEEDRKILTGMKDIIAEELNVKEVEINSDEKDLVDYSAKANFKVLGSRLGKAMKEVAASIQQMRSEKIAQILEGFKHEVSFGENQKVEISADDLVIQRNEKENLKVLNEGQLTVGFDTEVDQNLINEGLARDIIRAIQTLRKESGFEVSDRIRLIIGGDDEVKAAYDQFKSFIESETLTLSSEFDANLDVPENDFGVRIKISKV
ncbi:MAG: isoleucine--tRNA ligase, partial [Spirochaetales bacterium]|nr:isoleucine--tRNA ligase [Spirochaetales bacterium]